MEATMKMTPEAPVRPPDSFSVQKTKTKKGFFFPVVVPHCKAQFYPIYPPPQLVLTFDLEHDFYKSPKLNEFSPFFPESGPQGASINLSLARLC